MSYTKEMRFGFSNVRKKLILELVINWLLPLGFYWLMRSFIASDSISLTAAGAIPAVRVIIHLVIRRRIDWIGAASVLVFAVAVAISSLLGGSSLPLKLYRPVITGTIGIAFLFSAIIKRPLLMLFIRSIKNRITDKLTGTMNIRKITIITAVVGLVFLCDAAAHIIMALTLPTGTFLVSSRIVTFTLIAVLIGVRMFARRQR